MEVIDMRKKIIVAMILGICLFLVCIVLFTFFFFPLKGGDTVVFREEMKVSIVTIDSGYLITIVDVPEPPAHDDIKYPDSNETMSYEILNSEKEIVSSEKVTLNSTVTYSDNNTNFLIDEQDTFSIENRDHSYSGFYIIIKSYKITIINEKIP